MIRTSLTYRLNATILMIVLVMTSVTVMSSSYFLYQRTIAEMKADADQTASLAELSLIDRLWDFDAEGVADIARSLLLDQAFAAVKIQDKSGHIQVSIKAKDFENVSMDEFSPDDFFKVYRLISKGTDEIGRLEVLVSTRVAKQKILSSTLTIIVVSLLLSLVLTVSVAFAADRLIKRPIFKLRKETDEVIHGNLLSPIDQSRDDELGALARDFVQMRDSIREKIGIIEHQNHHLEEKVRDRTSQLEGKTKELLAVFSSLQEGILTLSDSKSFESQHSPYVLEIFRIASIEGLGVKDLLYPHAANQSDASAQCLSALDAILGSPELNYDLNRFLLPREHTIFVEGQTKILDLSWSPVVSDIGIVEKMVLCVRDITEIQAVRALARVNQETVRSLQELMNCEASTYNLFFDALPGRIDSIRQLVSKNTADSVRDAMRALHTIKGNSRTFGFAALSDKTHEIEGMLKDALHGTSVLRDPQSILIQIARLNEIYLQYQNVRFKILKISQGEIRIKFGDLIEDLLRDLKGQEVPAARELSDRLREIFKSQDLRSHLESMGQSALPSIARDCSKPEPEFNIYGGNILMDSHRVGILNDVLIHLFRNSMDHGIEAPAERELQQKPARGQIDIYIHEMLDQLEIIYQDDGHGLDINRMREVMIAKNLLKADEIPTRSQIEEVLFKDGFSTSDRVTAVSGRGIGMSAVRSMIVDQAGSIRCDLLRKGALDGGLAKIRWVIRLPLDKANKKLPTAS